MSSKMVEYLAASTGYDANGTPASAVQFTFGYAPFMMADDENIGDVVDIQTVCDSDAIAEINFVDSVAQISFDFATELNTLGELTTEIEDYKIKRAHVTESLQALALKYDKAVSEENQEDIDKYQMQLRALSIPFLAITLIPACFDGTVHVGFDNDPKFIFYTSDKLNQLPTKVTFIFESEAVYVQDGVDIYREDEEEEIRAQQEEMWYMDEAKKMEEEAYRMEYAYDPMEDLYNGGDYGDKPEDKRLKGVRLS